MAVLPQADTRIDRSEVSVYKIPTDMSESDGTYTWDSTTLVVVRLGTRAGDGEQILLQKIREAAAKKELVVADGFRCREQIIQTTGRNALHTTEVLQGAMKRC